MSDQDPRDVGDAEIAVLGAIFLGGTKVLDSARETGLRAGHFYRPANEALYLAMERLALRGQRIDLTTLGASLSAEERRAVGGPQYLTELVTAASGLPFVEAHSRAIIDAAVLRSLQSAGVKITQLAHSAPLDQSREALERARATLDEVEVPEEAESLVSAAELLPSVLDRMEDGAPRGVSTGIGDLDRLLGGGLGRGQSIIVGARPSVGKSMLGVNLAAAAAKKGVPTVLFSHEMTREELMQRLLAAETGVELTRLRSGRLSEDNWSDIASATSRISDWPLLIDDQSGMTIADYRARLRKLTRRRKVGLVISDYLQLIKPTDPRVPREQQVAGISAGAKAMSKDFDCPMVLLAQLSRATEQRRDARPILSDLRESGAIENDADVVILMHQDERTGGMELNVAKNRQGERGVVELYWHPRIMRCGAL